VEYRAFAENLDLALWQAVPGIDPVWKIRQLLVKLAMRFAQGSLCGSEQAPAP
jgi:hypothetical protein